MKTAITSHYAPRHGTLSARSENRNRAGQAAESRPLGLSGAGAYAWRIGRAAMATLLACSAGVTLSTWGVAQGGEAVVGATLFATGLVLIAWAFDRPRWNFISPLSCGLGMMALALLGHDQAPEFHVLAALIPGLGLGYTMGFSRNFPDKRINRANTA